MASPPHAHNHSLVSVVAESSAVVSAERRQATQHMQLHEQAILQHEQVIMHTHASVVPTDVGASLVVAVALRGAGVPEGVMFSMCLAHQARRHQARQERGGKPHVGHQ